VDFGIRSMDSDMRRSPLPALDISGPMRLHIGGCILNSGSTLRACLEPSVERSEDKAEERATLLAVASAGATGYWNAETTYSRVE
jgi:hypothetical protein